MRALARIGAAGLSLALLAVLACGSDDGEDIASVEPQAERGEDKAETHPVHTADTGPIDILLTARDGYSYLPDRIHVAAGEDVKFRLTSDDELHTFSIPKLGISHTVQPGEDTRFSHTFREPGIYGFICQIYPEEMSGTLVVQDVQASAK